jgi:nitrite reductase (NO-forming)
MKSTASDDARQTMQSWPQDFLRIGFGLIWLIDASLKWLPGFRATYASAVTTVSKGQPHWLKWWFDFWTRVQEPRPTSFAYMVAILETLVGLAIVLGFARKLTYIASALYGLMIWSVAEGFGGPYINGSTDIGTGIIYTLVSVGLLTICYYAGVSRHSIDYHLEGRITWWWKLAEMRRPGNTAFGTRSTEEHAATERSTVPVGS